MLRYPRCETFPKFGNLTEGKTFGRLRIPIFGGKKWKIWIDIQKIARKKNSGNSHKKSFDKNGPKTGKDTINHWGGIR